jgi:N-acetylglucosaminyl-diphospho-decaprenol L-rhamnosyltransferase
MRHPMLHLTRLTVRQNIPEVKVAAIVVNYRTPQLTMRCVDALLRELPSVGPFQVIVVENDSGDESLATLESAVRQPGWSEHVKLIAASRNGGLSYGINRALLVLFSEAEPPDYIWNINPDALPEPGAARALVTALEEDPSVGIVGSQVLTMDGQVVGGAFRPLSLAAELGWLGRLPPLRSLLSRYEVHPDPHAVSCEVAWVPGCSMLIRRQVFSDIGLFDEGFFLYFEESDFCQRARRAGWRIRYCTEGPVRHEGSASTGMNDVFRRMPRYWFDSRRRYYRKHHGLLYATLCEAAALAGTAVDQGVAVFRRGSIPTRPKLLQDALVHMVSGLIDGTAPDSESFEAEAVESRGVAFRSARSDVQQDFWEVVAEDFRTHDRLLTEPGFWALFAHRIGSHGGQGRCTRTAARLAHRALSTTVDWVWGIHLSSSAKIGRRVRIWHSGCIVVDAREIGDDVCLRHNTTIGAERSQRVPPSMLPVIEAGVDIGSGACVLGPVVIGAGAFIGANSVVLKTVAPGMRVLGVPARPIPI